MSTSAIHNALDDLRRAREWANELARIAAHEPGGMRAEKELRAALRRIRRILRDMKDQNKEF